MPAAKVVGTPDSRDLSVPLISRLFSAPYEIISGTAPVYVFSKPTCTRRFVASAASGFAHSISGRSATSDNAWQMTAPGPLTVPAGHTSHDDLPVNGWNVPAAQSVAPVCPIRFTKLPAGAGRHCD